MKVVHGERELRDASPTVVSVGVFDGVHKGHQALMARVVEVARQRSAVPAVLTFDRHPLEIIAPEKKPPLITTLEQRAAVMEQVGIELLLVLSFDERLRRLSAKRFVRRYLVDALHAVDVVVGANFRFGYRHAGTVDTLRRLGDRFGFGVEIFSLVGEPVGEGEQTLSSSLIRRQLQAGEVEAVAEELGRPFRLEGKVQRGAGRGRGLGIPTANLEVIPGFILPRPGVYAGWLAWQGRRHPAAINVGFNPTFEDRTEPIVEAHVLGDFHAELYGEVVGVEFTHRLRNELKFPDADSMMVQIDRDLVQIRQLLGA